MLKYTGQLYAKIGRKYIPTGKTGEDWDAMEIRLRLLQPDTRPAIGCPVEFEWNGKTMRGVVTTYAQCADDCFEVIADKDFGNEVFVLNMRIARILPNH